MWASRLRFQRLSPYCRLSIVKIGPTGAPPLTGAANADSHSDAALAGIGSGVGVGVRVGTRVRVGVRVLVGVRVTVGVLVVVGASVGMLVGGRVGVGGGLQAVIADKAQTANPKAATIVAASLFGIGHPLPKTRQNAKHPRHCGAKLVFTRRLLEGNAGCTCLSDSRPGRCAQQNRIVGRRYKAKPALG